MGGSTSREGTPTEIKLIIDFSADTDHHRVEVRVRIDNEGNRQVNKNDMDELFTAIKKFSLQSGNDEKKLKSLVVDAERNVWGRWYLFSESEPYEYNKETMDEAVAKLASKISDLWGDKEVPDNKVFFAWYVPVAPDLNPHITSVMLKLAKVSHIKLVPTAGEYNSTREYMLEHMPQDPITLRTKK